MAGPILIMAGGTGGHVFPALAVAELLRARHSEVEWLGTRRGIEAGLVPDRGFRLHCIRVSGLRGKGFLSWLLAPFRLAVALFDALRLMRRLEPELVLGMGGFASGPGGLAAWLLRRPLVIHEQNSVAGLTNRLLAGIAREVLEAFPGSFSGRVETRVIGNPVRPEIAALPDPSKRFAERSGPLRLLVLGGSQGALVLNETVPQAIALLAEHERPVVRHQAGRSTIDEAREAYAKAGLPVELEEFIDDMAGAYAWADFVVCRAGALTIAELAAAGLGSILVPFPSAVDDHQTRNAQYLVDADAAVLIPQKALGPGSLAAELRKWTKGRERPLVRASRARELARPDAALRLADACRPPSTVEVAA
jgi:UDP-N-acetylglucosamine--N-acetylmuramyl-(pentapeptide) pyrophosphoryl-undecaprenol N-acetylglucosamine transferase